MEECSLCLGHNQDLVEFKVHFKTFTVSKTKYLICSHCLQHQFNILKTYHELLNKKSPLIIKLWNDFMMCHEIQRDTDRINQVFVDLKIIEPTNNKKESSIENKQKNKKNNVNDENNVNNEKIGKIENNMKNIITTITIDGDDVSPRVTKRIIIDEDDDDGDEQQKKSTVKNGSEKNLRNKKKRKTQPLANVKLDLTLSDESREIESDVVEYLGDDVKADSDEDYVDEKEDISDNVDDYFPVVDFQQQVFVPPLTIEQLDLGLTFPLVIDHQNPEFGRKGSLNRKGHKHLPLLNVENFRKKLRCEEQTVETYKYHRHIENSLLSIYYENPIDHTYKKLTYFLKEEVLGTVNLRLAKNFGGLFSYTPQNHVANNFASNYIDLLRYLPLLESVEKNQNVLSCFSFNKEKVEEKKKLLELDKKMFSVGKCISKKDSIYHIFLAKFLHYDVIAKFPNFSMSSETSQEINKEKNDKNKNKNNENNKHKNKDNNKKNKNNNINENNINENDSQKNILKVEPPTVFEELDEILIKIYKSKEYEENPEYVHFINQINSRKKLIEKEREKEYIAQKQFQSDYEILLIISSYPCFVKFYGAFSVSDPIRKDRESDVLIFEHSKMGNFKNWVEKEKGDNTEIINNILKNVCYALFVIHEFLDRSLWMDLNMENILLFKENDQIIAKLSEIKFRREDSFVPVSKLSLNSFLAPEISLEIEKRKKSFFDSPEFGNFYTKESNIFSLGKIIQFSFGEDEIPEIWDAIVDGCCEEDPEERIEIDQILSKL